MLQPHFMLSHPSTHKPIYKMSLTTKELGGPCCISSKLHSYCKYLTRNVNIPQIYTQSYTLSLWSLSLSICSHLITIHSFRYCFHMCSSSHQPLQALIIYFSHSLKPSCSTFFQLSPFKNHCLVSNYCHHLAF